MTESVEGTVPSQWWLDLKAENARLTAELAEANRRAEGWVQHDTAAYSDAVQRERERRDEALLVADELRAALADAERIDAMDDAVHIASPWAPRKALCGQYDRRNLAPFGSVPPDGMSGCWSCLQALDWLRARVPAPAA